MYEPALLDTANNPREKAKNSKIQTNLRVSAGEILKNVLCMETWGSSKSINFHLKRLILVN